MMKTFFSLAPKATKKRKLGRTKTIDLAKASTAKYRSLNTRTLLENDEEEAKVSKFNFQKADSKALREYQKEMQVELQKAVEDIPLSLEQIDDVLSSYYFLPVPKPSWKENVQHWVKDRISGGHANAAGLKLELLRQFKTGRGYLQFLKNIGIDTSSSYDPVPTEKVFGGLVEEEFETVSYRRLIEHFMDENCGSLEPSIADREMFKEVLKSYKSASFKEKLSVLRELDGLNCDVDNIPDIIDPLDSSCALEFDREESADRILSLVGIDSSGVSLSDLKKRDKDLIGNNELSAEETKTLFRRYNMNRMTMFTNHPQVGTLVDYFRNKEMKRHGFGEETWKMWEDGSFGATSKQATSINQGWERFHAKREEILQENSKTGDDLEEFFDKIRKNYSPKVAECKIAMYELAMDPGRNRAQDIANEALHLSLLAQFAKKTSLFLDSVEMTTKYEIEQLCYDNAGMRKEYDLKATGNDDVRNLLVHQYENPITAISGEEVVATTDDISLMLPVDDVEKEMSDAYDALDDS